MQPSSGSGVLNLHRVAFRWPGGARLEIEWSGGKEGPATPPPRFPFLVEASLEAEPDKLSRIGRPAVCWEDLSGAAFQPLQLREATGYLVDVVVPVPLEDAVKSWEADRSWPLLTVPGAYRSHPPRRWSSEVTCTRVTGELDFGLYVGTAELAVPDETPIYLEVACTKLTYFDDFRRLLSDIVDEYISLVLEIEAPTFSRFAVAEMSDSQVATFLFLLRHAMEETRLPAAVDRIVLEPRSALVQERRHLPIGLGRSAPTAATASQIRLDEMVGEGPLRNLFRGFTPRAVPEDVRHETVDTIENRYVKGFLWSLLVRVQDLRDRLHDCSKRVVACQVEAWTSQVSEWIRKPMWKEVGDLTYFPSNSQILQKEDAYREVLAADLRLQLGMSLPLSAAELPEESIRGDLRPISLLYEYWCFLFLRSILRGICGPEIQYGTLVRRDRSELKVTLKRGSESRQEFRLSECGAEGGTLTLFYNRRFSRPTGDCSEWDGSYSAALRPDMSILLEVPSRSAGRYRHWLHFDAKYRLDIEQWRTLVQADLNGLSELETELSSDVTRESLRRSYRTVDLLKAHAYRDALLGSRGSYILFPGADNISEVFVRLPGASADEESPLVPSVGAFQANPGGRDRQAAVLAGFVTRCIQQLVSTTTYQEETGISQ